MGELRPRSIDREIRSRVEREGVCLFGPLGAGKSTLVESLSTPTRMAPFLTLDDVHRRHGLRPVLGSAPLPGSPAGDRETRWLATSGVRLDDPPFPVVHLHPFSMAELRTASVDTFEQLLRCGGFPEPFLGGSADRARRWAQAYRERIVHEEIPASERIDDPEIFDRLLRRLPLLVGAPLSLDALRRELRIAHKTLVRRLETLERHFQVFRLRPWGAESPRALKKTQKCYLTDWSVVPDEAARFENLVAAALLKWVHWSRETRGRNLELRHFRDIDFREVDFVVLEDGEPILFVDTKSKFSRADVGSRYLCTRFSRAETWQIHASGLRSYRTKEGVRVAHARVLLPRLA